MNSFAFFAVVVTLACVSLLVTTLGIRPWQSRQKHFIALLVAAILWGVSEVLRGAGVVGQYAAPLGGLSVVLLLLLIPYGGSERACALTSTAATGTALRAKYLPSLPR